MLGTNSIADSVPAWISRGAESGDINSKRKEAEVDSEGFLRLPPILRNPSQGVQDYMRDKQFDREASRRDKNLKRKLTLLDREDVDDRKAMMHTPDVIEDTDGLMAYVGFDYNDPDLDEYARAAFDLKVNAAMRHREIKQEINRLYHNEEQQQAYSSGKANDGKSKTARPTRRLSNRAAWLNPLETRRVRTELQLKKNSPTQEDVDPKNHPELPSFAPILSPSVAGANNNRNTKSPQQKKQTNRNEAKSPYSKPLAPPPVIGGGGGDNQNNNNPHQSSSSPSSGNTPQHQNILKNPYNPSSKPFISPEASMDLGSTGVKSEGSGDLIISMPQGISGVAGTESLNNSMRIKDASLTSLPDLEGQDSGSQTSGQQGRRKLKGGGGVVVSSPSPDEGDLTPRQKSVEKQKQQKKKQELARQKKYEKRREERMVEMSGSYNGGVGSGAFVNPYRASPPINKKKHQTHNNNNSKNNSTTNSGSNFNQSTSTAPPNDNENDDDDLMTAEASYGALSLSTRETFKQYSRKPSVVANDEPEFKISDLTFTYLRLLEKNESYSRRNMEKSFVEGLQHFAPQRDRLSAFQRNLARERMGVEQQERRARNHLVLDEYKKEVEKIEALMRKDADVAHFHELQRPACSVLQKPGGKINIDTTHSTTYVIEWRHRSTVPLELFATLLDAENNVIAVASKNFTVRSRDGITCIRPFSIASPSLVRLGPITHRSCLQISLVTLPFNTRTILFSVNVPQQSLVHHTNTGEDFKGFADIGKGWLTLFDALPLITSISNNAVNHTREKTIDEEAEEMRRNRMNKNNAGRRRRQSRSRIGGFGSASSTNNKRRASSLSMGMTGKFSASTILQQSQKSPMLEEVCTIEVEASPKLASVVGYTIGGFTVNPASPKAPANFFACDDKFVGGKLLADNFSQVACTQWKRDPLQSLNTEMEFARTAIIAPIIHFYEKFQRDTLEMIEEKGGVLKHSLYQDPDEETDDDPRTHDFPEDPQTFDESLVVEDKSQTTNNNQNTRQQQSSVNVTPFNQTLDVSTAAGAESHQPKRRSLVSIANNHDDEETDELNRSTASLSSPTAAAAAIGGSTRRGSTSPSYQFYNNSTNPNNTAMNSAMSSQMGGMSSTTLNNHYNRTRRKSTKKDASFRSRVPVSAVTSDHEKDFFVGRTLLMELFELGRRDIAAREAEAELMKTASRVM